MHVRKKHKFYALIALNSIALFTCVLLLIVLTFMPLGKNVEAQQYDIQSLQRFQQMNGLGVRAITPTPMVLPVYKLTPTPIIIANGGVPTATPTALYTHGRKPNDGEWNTLSSWFPNLNRWETRITDESTWNYNCHRWAIEESTTGGFLVEEMDDNGDGFIEVWEYDLYMEDNGYTSCPPDDPDREVTMYMEYDEEKDKFEASHSSRIFPDNPDLEESKLAEYPRITHPRDGLDGGVFGTQTMYYKPKN